MIRTCPLPRVDYAAAASGSWTLFKDAHCKCSSNRLAWIKPDHTPSATTPEACSAQCQSNAACRSFGMWTQQVSGSCATYDHLCTWPCADSMNADNGYKNDVYNMNSGSWVGLGVGARSGQTQQGQARHKGAQEGRGSRPAPAHRRTTAGPPLDHRRAIIRPAVQFELRFVGGFGCWGTFQADTGASGRGWLNTRAEGMQEVGAMHRVGG